MPIESIGFFTRLLGGTAAPQRYRDALEEIELAERRGYARAWVAQHHLSGDEGGLPSPLVFLAHAAAHTSRIRLATGIVTIGLENPVRVAEDAAVLDVLADGRLDLGLGSGGSAAAFDAFGIDGSDRAALYENNVARLRAALNGDLTGPGDLIGSDGLGHDVDVVPAGDTSDIAIWPAAPTLAQRLWQATFSANGGRRAGLAGDGLLLSRTQPRPADEPDAPLDRVQNRIIEEYLAALPAGATPRILASRTVYVTDDRERAFAQAATGIRRVKSHFERLGQHFDGDDAASLIRGTDAHVGTPDDVIASLAADTSLAHATEIAIQVHSIDPPSVDTRRSLELFATEVAPRLGYPVALEASPR